jgi:hypothetical protein
MTKRNLLTDAEWEAIHQAFTYKPMDEVWNRFKQTSLRFKASYLFLNCYIACYWVMHSISMAQNILPSGLLIADPMMQQVMAGRLLIGLIMLTILNAAFYFRVGFKTASLALLIAYFYATLSVTVVLVPLVSESSVGITEFLWVGVRLVAFWAMWQLYRSEEL